MLHLPVPPLTCHKLTQVPKIISNSAAGTPLKPLSQSNEDQPVPATRCGLLAIVGRPNVGKSTLINALVGQKISITSSKAQTTRHRITGVVTKGLSQFVIADTPGYQTHYGAALNKSLNKAVLGAVGDVDLVLMVVEAGKWNDADRQVHRLIGEKVPVILVANKLDMIHRRETLMPWLQSVQAEGQFAEVVPMSANSPKDADRLLAICEPYLHEQAWWYREDELTDKSEKFLAAEIVREKLFRLTGDELPYTSTVLIEKFEEEPAHGASARMLRIAATIVVEREGHKAMVIGRDGEKIKRIGTDARRSLETLMDAKVILEVWVKVRSGWADDEAKLRTFGYE